MMKQIKHNKSDTYRFGRDDLRGFNRRRLAQIRPQAEPSARYRFPAVDRGDTKRGSSLLHRGSLSSICTFVSFESVGAVSELKHLAHISETVRSLPRPKHRPGRHEAGDRRACTSLMAVVGPMLILRLVFGAARGVINTTLLAFGLVSLSGRSRGWRSCTRRPDVVRWRIKTRTSAARSTTKPRPWIIAHYLKQGGQTAGHRELWRLLKTLFKQDNDTDQVT
jgi:hypothetical protein